MKSSRSIGSFSKRMTLLAATFACFSVTSFAATFTNSAPITITASGQAGTYPSTVTAAGLSGNITSVKVTLNGFSHTWTDDVGMVLVGPTGAALGLQSGAGDEDLGTEVSNVTYSFADSGAANLPDLDEWGPGIYKPTNYYFPLDNFPAPGPGTTYGNPGPAGAGTATFASTFNGTSGNGDWKLFIFDYVAGDGGSISGGWSIEINTVVVDNFGSVLDYDGDGKSDYIIGRPSGSNGPVTVFIKKSGGGSEQFNFGLSTGDIPVPGNFDGDSRSDIAIFRQSTGTWYILQSQTSTFRIEAFGLENDDPTVIGDYDGDGKDDLAVYRNGASAGQQSTWYYRTSPGGALNAVAWGVNGDYPAPGDYDGDGKNDFVVQRAEGTSARFWIRSASGAVSTVPFGLATDIIVPGDYDGDGKTDIAVTRLTAGGQITWFYQPSSGGGFRGIVWGSLGSYNVQGDYDGDGKTDVAVWKEGYFYVLGTTSGQVITQWGVQNDYPIGNYNTH